MNIQQLRIIVELSKGKSLNEIGELMEITQPTVSFHIRKLEEEMGIPLFLKEKRSLILNKACLVLVPYAKEILSLMDEAKHKVELVHDMEQPRLRITASHTPATYYLPPYLQQFQHEHPEIEVSLSVCQAQWSIQLLKDRLADLAIISLNNFTVKGLNIHPIKNNKMLLTYAPTNRLASLPEITVDDLENETFLLAEEGTTSRTVTNDWANQIGFNMSHKMELSSIEAIKEGVKCDMGIGILPEMGICQELDAGQMLSSPLPQYEHRRCICLVYRDEEQISEYVDAFVWFAIENMK
jgi:DNA-binding transcriptional LysR family regulator